MKSPLKRVSFSTEDNSSLSSGKVVEAAAKILNCMELGANESKQQLHHQQHHHQINHTSHHQHLSGNKIFDSPAITSRSNESTESTRAVAIIEKEQGKIKQNKLAQQMKAVEDAFTDIKGQARGFGFRSLRAGLLRSDMSTKNRYHANIQGSSPFLLHNSSIKQHLQTGAAAPFSLVDLYPSGSTLHIQKIIASNLRNVELIGNNDPYILLNFNGGFWNGKTPVIPGGGSELEWSFQPNEPGLQFQLTATDLHNGVFSVQAMDSNSFRSDAVIGTGEMNLRDGSYYAIDSNLGSLTISTSLHDNAGRISGTVTVSLTLEKSLVDNNEGSPDNTNTSGPVPIYGYGEPSSELLLSSTLPPVPVLYTNVFKTVRSQNFIETSGYKWAIAKELTVGSGKGKKGKEKVTDERVDDKKRQSPRKRNESELSGQIVAPLQRVSSPKLPKRVISLHTVSQLTINNSGSIIEAGKFKKQIQKELQANNSFVRNGSTFYTDLDEPLSPQPSHHIDVDKSKSMQSSDEEAEGDHGPATASSEAFDTATASKLLSSRNPNKIKKAKQSKFKIVTMLKDFKSWSSDNIDDFDRALGNEEEIHAPNFNGYNDRTTLTTVMSPSNSGSPRSWSQINERNNNSRLMASPLAAQSSRSAPSSNRDKSKWARPQSSPPFRRVDVDKQLFPITEMSSHSGLEYEHNNNNSHHHYQNQLNNSTNGHNHYYQNNSKTAETETTMNSENLTFGSCLSSPLDIGRQGSDYSKGELQNRPRSSNLRRLPLLIHVLDAAEIRKTIQ